MEPRATEFQAFSKIPRWNKEIVVTEKIDGTNAQIFIDLASNVFLTGSRNRWVTPDSDNHGFSNWAHEHKTELLTLGNGRHFGEWWGSGIQRGYATKDKHFSLFNISRYCLSTQEPKNLSCDPELIKLQTRLPACCGLVPVLWTGLMDQLDTKHILLKLHTTGSHAAPGYMEPEGIVIFHTASGHLYKRTFSDIRKGE
jgi:hypothetical protein